MEKELTLPSIRDGGLTWFIIGLFGFSMKMFDIGDKEIGGAALAGTVVLVLIQAYYKPN
ncbi:MAG: hypothetical protein KAJ03_01765 [Gammaproteobacteria bacterium]|nr:hypothetical protein [Gammaproteobacteria bacterium]